VAAAAVVGIVSAWSVLAAGASVGNPGPVTIALHDGALSTALGSFSPITGSMAGTVDASGALVLPQAGISFTPFDISVTNPLPLTVHITPVASSDWSGTIDPTTGHVTLIGVSLRVRSDR
jgi:hypothetical protein